MKSAEFDPRPSLRAIEESTVPRLLGSREAIVLECIARGGGATRWYSVRSAEQLSTLAARLRPGSRVSFYFDGRFQSRVYGPTVLNEILRGAAPGHDIIIAAPSADGIELEHGYICGPGDLDAYPDMLRPGRVVIFGPDPPRENDGDRAVTLVLPDSDGVVRRHPY
jgi:hypothetical protein